MRVGVRVCVSAVRRLLRPSLPLPSPANAGPFSRSRAHSLFLRRDMSSQPQHTSRSVEELGGGMTVRVLPALADNYMYVLEDRASGEAAVVDPVNPEMIMSEVKSSGVKLTSVLTTHHHWDHAGGNEQLASLVAGLKVYGNDDRIGALNQTVKHNQEFKLGNLTVQCLLTPCHTTGHVCYFVTTPDKAHRAVFTGDTLFVGGCGRFFEGTPQQMYSCLFDVLVKLPPDTRIFCGHEYTVNNLIYAQHVEGSNKAIKDKLEWAKEKRAQNLPTVPSTIEQEMTYNPFLRVKEERVKNYARKSGKSDPVDVMGYLREEKNNFRPRM